MNTTTDEDADLRSTANFAFSATYTVLFAFGLTNAAVLFYVGAVLKRGSASTVYLFNLHVAELLVLFILPSIAVWFLLEGAWLFGTFWCRMFHAVKLANKSTVAHFLALLSLDRYFAVCRRVDSRKLRELSFILPAVILCWIIASVSAITVFGITTLDYEEARPGFVSLREDQCKIVWSTNSTLAKKHKITFGVVSFSFFFLLPGMVATICSVRVIVHSITPLRKRENLGRIRSMLSTSILMPEFASVVPMTPEAGEPVTGILRINNMTRLTLLLNLAYFLCWTPYWIQSLLLKWLGVKTSSFSGTYWVVYQTIQALPYLTCVVNPILFYFIKFRKRRRTTRQCQIATLSERTPAMSLSALQINGACRSSNVLQLQANDEDSCWSRASSARGETPWIMTSVV